MRRFVITGLLVAGVLVGFWYAFNDEEINSVSDLWKSLSAGVPQNTEFSGDTFMGSDVFANDIDGVVENQARGRANLIRIASFNIELSADKQNNTANLVLLSRVLSHFDVIALQGLAASNQTELSRLVELLNQAGNSYSFVLGPKSENSDTAHQFAFVYNQQRIILDQNSVYTIDDPDDIFRYDPCVGWFMTRGPKPEQAFTFSLVNIFVDPFESYRETNMLGQLYRAVRDDGRGEDDVILLGDLNSADEELKYLNRQSRLSWVVSKSPTDTLRERQSDNIIFYAPAAVEYTGRGGVYDFLKELNLTIEEALQVSSHMPVWAEFQIQEVNSPGRVANFPHVTAR